MLVLRHTSTKRPYRAENTIKEYVSLCIKSELKAWFKKREVGYAVKYTHQRLPNTTITDNSTGSLTSVSFRHDNILGSSTDSALHIL